MATEKFEDVNSSIIEIENNVIDVVANNNYQILITDDNSTENIFDSKGYYIDNNTINNISIDLYYFSDLIYLGEKYFYSDYNNNISDNFDFGIYDSNFGNLVDHIPIESKNSFEQMWVLNDIAFFCVIGDIYNTPTYDNRHLIALDAINGEEIDILGGVCANYCQQTVINDICFWQGNYYVAGRFSGAKLD